MKTLEEKVDIILNDQKSQKGFGPKKSPYSIDHLKAQFNDLISNPKVDKLLLKKIREDIVNIDALLFDITRQFAKETKRLRGVKK